MIWLVTDRGANQDSSRLFTVIVPCSVLLFSVFTYAAFYANCFPLLLHVCLWQIYMYTCIAGAGIFEGYRGVCFIHAYLQSWCCRYACRLQKISVTYMYTMQYRWCSIHVGLRDIYKYFTCACGATLIYLVIFAALWSLFRTREFLQSFVEKHVYNFKTNSKNKKENF